MSHATDILQHPLRHEIRYPSQMQHVDRGILGEGYYPGARGASHTDFPVDKVMLVGRDFGTRDYYDRLCGHPPRSETALTWRHTKKTYLQVLGSSNLWCTNYLMGVRVSGSAKGNVAPSMKSEDWAQYEQSCWQFFLKQIDLQKPKLLVIFGDDNYVDLLQKTRIAATPKVVSLREGGGYFCTHEFALQSGTHKANVYFAKHPHSAIGAANTSLVMAQAGFALHMLKQ